MKTNNCPIPTLYDLCMDYRNEKELSAQGLSKFSEEEIQKKKENTINEIKINKDLIIELLIEVVRRAGSCNDVEIYRLLQSYFYNKVPEKRYSIMMEIIDSQHVKLPTLLSFDEKFMYEILNEAMPYWDDLLTSFIR